MGDPVKGALLNLLQYFHNPELVGSVLLLYVIHVVSLTVNTPHAFLNGLKVIIAPTEEAVLKLRPDAKGPRPEPLRQKEIEGKDPDAYDKMNALGLVRLEISRGTLGTLPYFPAYEGMVTWAIVALGNFLIAQGSRCALPAKRPMGWATLTIVAALLRAVWCNVHLIGLLGMENDHSKFAVFCGFCGLFISAAIGGGMLPTGFFAFDLEAAVSALYGWGKEVAVAVRGSEGAPLSLGMNEADFKALFVPSLAVSAACVTAAAALPSIRFAQYYQRALQSGSGVPFATRVLLVADVLLPSLVVLVWVRAAPPLFLGERRSSNWGWRLRMGITAGSVLLRLVLARPQLQAFLDGAKEHVLQELREKKVNVQAVRAKFEARFQYFMIAAAQYAAPALTVLLSIALCVHIGDADEDATLQDTSRNEGGRFAVNGLGVCDAARWAFRAKSWDEAVASLGGAEGSGENTSADFPGLPEAVWSGIAGFLAWWASLSWAVTYAIGVVFWKIYPEDVSVEERGRRDRTTKGKKDKVRGGKAKSKAHRGGLSAPDTGSS